MNIVKKISCGLLVCALALGAQAGTLYWQLNSNPNHEEYAALVIKNTGTGEITYANLLDGPGGSSVGNIVTESDARNYVQYADITDYDSSYIFYVEMLDAQTGRGWASTSYDYDQLVSQNYVYTGGMDPGAVRVWTASVVIPEPTSGLLLLVGGSLLALRRKRRA